jgi:hypothetical protein
MRPHFAEGRYVNYLNAEEMNEGGAVESAFGPNWRRLREGQALLRPGQRLPPEPEHQAVRSPRAAPARAGAASAPSRIPHRICPALPARAGRLATGATVKSTGGCSRSRRRGGQDDDVAPRMAGRSPGSRCASRRAPRAGRRGPRASLAPRAPARSASTSRRGASTAGSPSRGAGRWRTWPARRAARACSSSGRSAASST